MDMASAQGPCSSGTICTTTTVPDQTLNLFESDPTGPIMLNITANPGYSGMVQASLVRTGIDALSGGQEPDVHIGVVPPVFALSGGKTVSVTLHLGTTTAAAAFAAQPVTVHFQDSADQTKGFDVKFNMTVTNVLNISLNVTGGPKTNNSHTWSTDAVSVANGGAFTFNVRQRAVNGTTGGTTFIWHNMDTVNAHEVHGQGGINHQNTAAANAAPQPTNNPIIMTTNGGTYTQVLVNSTAAVANQTFGFYCHTDGQSTSDNGLVPGPRFIP
jgi:hypothetical protein